MCMGQAEYGHVKSALGDCEAAVRCMMRSVTRTRDGGGGGGGGRLSAALQRQLADSSLDSDADPQAAGPARARGQGVACA